MSTPPSPARLPAAGEHTKTGGPAAEETLRAYEHNALVQLNRLRIVLALLAVVGFLATSQERLTSLLPSLLILVSGALTVWFLRRRQDTGRAGLLMVTIDSVALASVPWLFYIAEPGAPPEFLLKNDEALFALSLAALYALPMRPLYPLLLAGITGLAHVLYYGIALRLGELTTTTSWLLTRTTEAVQIEGYFYTHLVLVPLGAAILALLTSTGRRLILRTSASERRSSQLGRYFSPMLAKRLGQGVPIERGGVVREIAVLFQDLQGFTGISEALGATATVDLLAEIHDVMVRTIFAEEGTLDKFLGDGLMACFGSIGDEEDLAGRAVRTALSMRAALASLNASRERRGEAKLHQRIGVHLGPAVVGNIGSVERLEFTAIGDTVNTAARVEASAKGLKTDILLTGAIVEKLRGRASVRSLGSVQLRGKDLETELFAVDRWLGEASSADAG